MQIVSKTAGVLGKLVRMQLSGAAMQEGYKAAT